VKACPNCGWSNDNQNRFCENCGADFEGLKSQGRDPEGPSSAWAPPPPLEPRSQPQVGSWETPPSAPDWRMAPLPPDEEVKQRGRRVWLWVLSGLLLVCMLSCAGAFLWLGYTDSGKDFQTSVAERETEVAD
jgi:hypothetical protein